MQHPFQVASGSLPLVRYSALGNLIRFISVFVASQFPGHSNKKPVDLWISLESKYGDKAEITTSSTGSTATTTAMKYKQFFAAINI